MPIIMPQKTPSIDCSFDILKIKLDMDAPSSGESKRSETESSTH